MKFSTRAEYGLRAMVNLARNYGNSYCSLAIIAKEEHISQAYLERLFARLKKAGLVKSTKGVNGGYQLCQKPAEIKIKAVFEALEGSLAPYYCVADGCNCLKDNRCLIQSVWGGMNEVLTKYLNSISLKNLIK